MNRWRELKKGMAKSGLPASDRAVFGNLHGCSDYRTGELESKFTPTLAKMADETGLSERQVRYSLRHLELHGWLKVSGATGRGHKPEYRLMLGGACDCTGRRHGKGATGRAERGQPDTPKGGSQCPPKGATEGGNVAGQAEDSAVSQRRGGVEGEAIEVEANSPPNGEHDDGDARLLSMTPARSCSDCGAPRDDEAGFIRHKPDCPWALTAALYDR